MAGPGFAKQPGRVTTERAPRADRRHRCAVGPVGVRHERRASPGTGSGRVLRAQPYEDATAIDLATGAFSYTPLFGGHVSEFAFSPDGRTAYAATGEGIKAINVETKQVEGESIGHEGWIKHIVVTPDGKHAFVDLDEESRIFDVELTGRHEDQEISLGEQGLGALAITPDGRTVFVVNSKLHAVIPVEVATHVVGAPIVVDAGEEKLGAMAMSPDGRTLYVTNTSSASIVPVDVATRSAGAPMRLSDWAITAIAVSPDGRTAYVTGRAYDSPVQTPGVLPVDLASGTAGALIAVGAEPSKQPNSIALTPDGRMAYVTSYEAAIVTPIDLTAGRAQPAIPVGNYPSAIAIDAAAAPATTPGAPAPSGPTPLRPVARAVHCMVPHLARIALPSIRKRLHRNHCRLGRVRYRHSRRRKGRLVSQGARPGQHLPANAKVRVVISRGPAPAAKA
jgi:DNA-binding beta-propeller fold protein YncE